MKRAINVLLTTYNSEKYLAELLDSILAQSFKDFKIFISDDCSTDSTSKILNYYHEQFPDRVEIYINNSNLGLTNNFNNLVSKINIGHDSKYIVCADHDDIWRVNKLEKQYNYMEKHNEVICSFHDRTLFDEKGILTDSEYKHDEFKLEYVGFKTMLKKTEVKYSFNTMIFRNNEILNKIFPIPKKFTQHDYWVSLFLAYYGGLIGYIHEPLIKYRIHNNNLSNKNRWEKLTLDNIKKMYSKQEIKIKEKRRLKDKQILKNELNEIDESIKLAEYQSDNFVFKLKKSIIKILPVKLIYILKKAQRKFIKNNNNLK